MIFAASTQYNDYRGTVALDRSDNLSLRTHLIETGLIDEGEIIVALKLGIGENHGEEVSNVGLVAYAQEANEYDPKPAKVRAIDTSMEISKFLSFFKRFELVYAHGERDLSETQVTYADE